MATGTRLRYDLASGTLVAALGLSSTTATARGTVDYGVGDTEGALAFINDSFLVAIDQASGATGDPLQVIDWSNPDAPALDNNIATLNFVSGIDVHTKGGVTYLLVPLAGNDGFDLYDVTDPTTPSLVFSGAGQFGGGRFLNDTYLAMVDPNNGRLSIYDWSNPAAPSLSHHTTGAGSGLKSLSISPDRTLLVASGSTSAVYDATDPSAVVPGSTLAVNTKNDAAVFDDGTVVIGNKVYDASNPASVSEVATLANTYNCLTRFSATRAVGVRAGVLDVIDISTPASPTVTESLTWGTTENATALAARGIYVGLLDDTGEVRIFDVQDLGETAINFGTDPGFATIGAGEYVPLVVGDTDATREIVHLTSFTAAATTGTVERAQEGTAALEHASGAQWHSGPTTQDFDVTELQNYGTLALTTLTVEDEAGTTYTVVAADTGKVKRFTANATVSLPDSLPIGTVVELMAFDAAGITVQAGGTATVHGGGTVAQYGTCSAIVVATDTWVVTGAS